MFDEIIRTCLDGMHCVLGVTRGSLRSYRWRYRLSFVTGEPMADRQIAELEEFLSLPFPPAYRAYLSIAGNERTSGGFQASDLHGEHLRSLKSRAFNIAKQSNHSIKFPDNAIFICEFEGYLTFFFTADGFTANPYVYSYCEGDACIKNSGKRLTRWLTGW